MNQLRLVLPFLLAALAVLAPPAEPGTARRMGLVELAENCDLAVEGRVVALQARRSGARWVETLVTLRVARTFVGEPCETLTVRLPGGVLPDGSGLLLPGMPQLALGEDVVLFLSPETPAGARLPVGLAQGKLRVVVQPDGAKRLVGDAAGLRLVGPPGTALGTALGIAPGTAPGSGPGSGPGIDYVAALAEIETGIAARRASRR